MNLSDIENTFSKMGGEFISSPIVISKKLKKIKALVFDWDGVWHSGRKDGTGNSSFSEVDSMGLNMLRFGYHLQNGQIPLSLIITGENNLTAFDFAEREHLDGVFFKVKNKSQALDFLLKKWKLKEEEVLFVFDDILDLGMAKRCGAGFMVKGKGNPMLEEFVIAKKMCLYRSAETGNTNAVREVAELCLALLGKFNETTQKRMDFAEDYTAYWELRNKQETSFYTVKGQKIISTNRP